MVMKQEELGSRDEDLILNYLSHVLKIYGVFFPCICFITVVAMIHLGLKKYRSLVFYWLLLLRVRRG
jgi:hypothetical protein